MKITFASAWPRTHGALTLWVLCSGCGSAPHAAEAPASEVSARGPADPVRDPSPTRAAARSQAGIGDTGMAPIAGRAGDGAQTGPAQAAIPPAGNAAGVTGTQPMSPTAAGAGAAGTAAPSAQGSGAPEWQHDPLDCGPDGLVIEDAGPPKNRLNYVIIGDGYTEQQLPTFKQHVDVAMKKRFSPVIGQPYGRYRKFVNICAIQLVSPNGPIGSGPTALDCSGDDQSRLARCDTKKVNMELAARLPESLEVDWKAVVLNNERWWNTGSVIMLWSGGNKDAAGAALHEGGHGFHQLADEYGGDDANCSREFEEVNSTADGETTAGKWDLWLGYDQADATGLQTTLAGSRYCQSGQYRPSQNSMMNQLFGDKPNTAYNAVSREKIIMDIWRAVTPIDATLPPEGEVKADQSLAVVVIDPEVISVDWSVDGELVAADGGTTFELGAHPLGSGQHEISAKAYDNAGPELVRYTTGTQYGRMNWARSRQTVRWTVRVP